MGKSSSLMYLWMRCLIIVFCTLMAISGFVLIGVGAWVVYGATLFVDAMGSYSAQLNISFICIAIGAFVSLTSVIGCCGAWKESRYFLLVFFFIVTALFIAELVGTVVVLMYRQLADVLVYEASKKALQTLYMGPGAADPVSTAWNTVMIKFKCCGFENSTSDFKDSVFSKTTGQHYPQTCCIDKTMPDCNGINMTDSLIHPEHDVDVLSPIYTEKVNILRGQKLSHPFVYITASCYKKVIAVIREHSAVLGATTGVMCIFKQQCHNPGFLAEHGDREMLQPSHLAITIRPLPKLLKFLRLPISHRSNIIYENFLPLVYIPDNNIHFRNELAVMSLSIALFVKLGVIQQEGLYE